MGIARKHLLLMLTHGVIYRPNNDFLTKAKLPAWQFAEQRVQLLFLHVYCSSIIALQYSFKRIWPCLKSRLRRPMKHTSEPCATHLFERKIFCLCLSISEQHLSTTTGVLQGSLFTRLNHTRSISEYWPNFLYRHLTEFIGSCLIKRSVHGTVGNLHSL